jgi:hypothetical protein
MRAVSADNVVDTDAARHAMNGVFIRDLVASGNALNVVDYGKRYYGRLPGLSMPYHPPFFPALEAIFFAIFGVGLFPARLAVAVAVAVSALLLYRLIMRTVGSHWTAAAATITFLFWRNSQAVAGDVMLEFPCLVFLLAALQCLVPLDPGNDGRAWLKRGLGFALFGAAALWSKQHALFLGMVPFALVALRRQWRSLVSLRLWVPPIIFGLSAIGLTLLTLPFKATGVTQLVDNTVDISWFQAVVVHNFRFYVNGSPGDFRNRAAHVDGRLDPRMAIVLAWTQSRPGIIRCLGRLCLFPSADSRSLRSAVSVLRVSRFAGHRVRLPGARFGKVFCLSGSRGCRSPRPSRRVQSQGYKSRPSF